MWKILGCLVFCVLLSPALGTVPGIRAAMSDVTLSEDIVYDSVLTEILNETGLLENQLKNLGLSDIHLEEPHSLFGNIVGLKTDKVILKNIVFVFFNGLVEESWSIRLGATGNVILPASSVITTSVDLTVKFAVGISSFSGGEFSYAIPSCVITIGAIDVKLLDGEVTSSQISTILQALTADLQEKLCPIVKTAYNEVNLAWFNFVNVDFPLGAYGNLKYQLATLPAMTPAYLGIDISVAFQYAESGVIVSIPDTAVPIAVPSLDNYRFCLAISPAAITILLSVFTPKVPLELSNSPTVFSKAEELKNALLALVPSEAPPDLATSELSLVISIGASPVIAFSTSDATVTLTANVNVLYKKADGSKVSVVIVSCNVSLKAAISLVNDKVFLGLSLSKNVLSLVFSGVGITDVSGLLDLINGLVDEIILPVFNAPLSLGLPLPPMLGFPLLNVTIKTVVNALVICL